MNVDKTMIGVIQYRDEQIELRPGRKRTEVRVCNRGDRPIQVGSHFHFFEANKALVFDRERAFGTHLDILSGTAVRFEPGEEKNVRLVAFGGKEKLIGFNGLTMGDLNDQGILFSALERANAKGYIREIPKQGEGGNYAD